MAYVPAVADTDERFSPPELIAFRDAMWPRGTDTDPAWHPWSFSRAEHAYTKADDGLAMPWFGRVWLNPPWSDPTRWIDRLLWHVGQACLWLGDVGHEGMLCVRNDPSTAWWSTAWKSADAIAFLSERTRYYQPAEDGALELCGTPTFTSVVFYYGAEVERFLATARAHGHHAVGLRNHSIGRRMRSMANNKPLAGDVLGEMVRDTIADYARAHPELTLGEIANMIPTEGCEDLLMSLKVRDLWPELGGGAANVPPRPGDGDSHRTPVPVRPNGKNGSARAAAPKKLSPERQGRVDAIVAWIGDRKEFRAADVMEALSVSRQTALRTLVHVPNVRVEGKAKNAKYVVI